jgi:hypothetical protein
VVTGAGAGLDVEEAAEDAEVDVAPDVRASRLDEAVVEVWAPIDPPV